jgi:radical SAM protein with 4Fe4S-binding SPASM domain
MNTSPGYSISFEQRARRDDPAKDEQIRSLRITPREGLALLARNEAKYRAAMQDATRLMGPTGPRLFPCGAGCGYAAVDAYGRAQPCLGIRSPELTVDLLHVSLADALESFAALGDVQATNPEYLTRCAICFLKGLCEQCPAKSWNENGTLDTPVEYLCDWAHAQARWMGWLGEEEHGWEVVEWRERLEQGKVGRVPGQQGED